MQEDKAKHPHLLLSWAGTQAHIHTLTHKHTHVDTLYVVTGRHIFGVSLQTGIPGQQRRDNVSALLVNSLFYPVSGPQSMNGVCFWHTHKHMPHMHTVRIPLFAGHFVSPSLLDDKGKKKKTEVIKDAHRYGCQHRQKLSSCVDVSEFSFVWHMVCGTRKCATLTDRM